MPKAVYRGHERCCPTCGNRFIIKRRNNLYCSENCRKLKYQKKNRQANPVNSSYSQAKRRTNMYFFERSLRLAELIYTSPINVRLGLMQEMVQSARLGEEKLIQILTNQMLLFNPDKLKWLHWRRCPESYPTITQAANLYCLKFWSATVSDVVRGKVAEPPTGEIVPNPSSTY